MSIIRVADLREQVYNELRNRIFSGAYPSDHRFYEAVLAKDLDVSRTPVREALALLAHDGLLVQRRRGFSFPRYEQTDVLWLTEARQRLEPYAMRQLVERQSPEVLAALAAFIRNEIAEHGDTEAFIGAHRRIRDRAFALMENTVLVNMMKQSDDFIQMVRLTSMADPYWRNMSVDGNRRKAELIDAGDAAGLEALMYELLDQTAQAYLQCLAVSEADEDSPTGRIVKTRPNTAPAAKDDQDMH